jgi:hypothetical protein
MEKSAQESGSAVDSERIGYGWCVLCAASEGEREKERERSRWGIYRAI